MTIYEIDSAITECIDAETGEIIDIDRLSQLEMAREQKIENVGCWIKELKAEAEAIKSEKQNLERRQKAAENKVEQLKNYLSFVLNGEKYKSARVSVSYRKSTSTEVNMEELLKYENAEVYLKKVEPEANKTVIKEALESGLEIAGCRLVEKQSVIIK
ncbi:MAG: siphovirus Gp157 family protein [Prevotellaceae bacterium]|nr:siphovirus Gp157 family protein [Prevotellaceae bacterium]